MCILMWVLDNLSELIIERSIVRTKYKRAASLESEALYALVF